MKRDVYFVFYDNKNPDRALEIHLLIKEQKEICSSRG